MAKRKKTLNRLQKLLRADGALCVTFVNTAAATRKSLETYDDLLAWGVETGALAAGDSQRLARAAAEHPGNAAGVVRRAKTLRARLERMLRALAAGDAVADDDFNPFNAELARTMAGRHLVATTSGHRWAWREAGDEDLDRMLWPVLLSAGNLLASEDRRARVRRCADEACGLLFLAKSSGKTRKWCGATCRNRSTSRSYYLRKIKPRRQMLSAAAKG